LNGYKLPYKTPYYQNVLKCIRKIAMGKGMASQRELLDMLGKQRPTKSFYRAMTQAELDGYVTKAGFTTERGGRGVGYEVHMTLEQMRLPFEPEFPF